MSQPFIDKQSEQERAFGNWQPGRFAWKFANPRQFKTPIPMRGMQGLFDVNQFERDLNEQIQKPLF